MKKIIRFTLLFICFNQVLKAEAQSDFPVKEWTGNDTKKAFVLYISGDGGLNSFSTNLCSNVNAKGYTITTLNSKSYFWDKKTPEQAAADIQTYLAKKANAYATIIIVGYSFGADVLPFIINRLPEILRKKISSIVLVSPSSNTDFEIHWSDMLGGGKKRSMNVVQEINKMRVTKITALVGNDEKEFPVKEITLKNFTARYLPGGHHFEGNITEVANTIISCF